jgi:hypothetical protein
MMNDLIPFSSWAVETCVHAFAKARQDGPPGGAIAGQENGGV